jgi:prepilin-type N-terminal cleavage/methylation domain-containing protein
MNQMKKTSGFTLIELLIVIAVIAILAAAVYVALDPQKRFKDSRDTRRAQDINQILTAVKVHQVDNKGKYLTAIASLTPGTVYMIGTAATGCDVACDSGVAGGDADCVNLSGLTTAGYLGSVPISPNGTGTWDATLTGYTMTTSSNGIIKVAACEHENVGVIASSR